MSQAGRWDSKSSASQADTQNLQAAGFPCASFGLCNSCLLRTGRQLGTFIVPCNLHRPIRTPCCRAFHAGYTHSRSAVQEEVSSVPRRINPLAKRLWEAVVTIGDVLCGSARAGGIDPRGEAAKHIVVELVLGRHRRGLLVRNTRERGIHHYPPLPMLNAIARDHLSGGFCFGERGTAGNSE